MTVLKRRDFARWQAGEKLPDTALCKMKALEAGVLLEVCCDQQTH